MRPHAIPASAARYLVLLCGLSGAALGGVATLNYIVDPYLIHQWDTAQLQRLRPPREQLSPWGKTYALARLRPAVVYAGNSRTELGLPVGAPAFAGQAVFNAALSGASLGDAAQMVRHAAAVGRIGTLVWGIDAPSFSLTAGNTELEQALVADGGLYLARRWLLNVKRSLAFDMTRDSLRLLAGSFGAVCRSSLATGGQRDDACVRARMAEKGGLEAAIAPRLGEFVRGHGPTADAMDAFAASMDALCRQQVRVRLYINPTHALMLDALYWSGKGAQLERWLGALAALAARERARGCDVRLYDFSGFNSVTTEALPQAGAEMAHYWEPSHYRASVGGMMVARMFGAGGAALPDDFGVELAPAMLPGHLTALHAGRARYHLAQPQAAARARRAAGR